MNELLELRMGMFAYIDQSVPLVAKA